MMVIWADTDPRLYRGSMGLEARSPAKNSSVSTITPGYFKYRFQSCLSAEVGSWRALREGNRGGKRQNSDSEPGYSWEHDG